jgi:hypothetical protein
MVLVIQVLWNLAEKNPKHVSHRAGTLSTVPEQHLENPAYVTAKRTLFGA